jgi:4-diphosphocytidyl-2-C-methyl-D-erythritol kinase
MLSNAKINLYLHVTGKLHSGYHSLESLIIPISICDNIYISSNESDTTTFTLKGQFAHLIDKSDNLILKAIDAISKYAKVTTKGWDIYLDKNIPVGAGLGGGSSDAATTLKIMNQLLGLNYSNETLRKIGISFGADIPFFIENRPALITGMGEIETLVDVPQLHLLLVYPNIALSTSDVFKHAPFRYSHEIPIINSHNDRDSFLSFLNLCDNELESNAINLAPQIKEVLEVISDQPGCLLARMSGSGSTCFGIFNSEFELRTSLNRLTLEYPDWWIKAI